MQGTKELRLRRRGMKVAWLESDWNLNKHRTWKESGKKGAIQATVDTARKHITYLGTCEWRGNARAESLCPESSRRFEGWWDWGPHQGEPDCRAWAQSLEAVKPTPSHHTLTERCKGIRKLALGSGVATAGCEGWEGAGGTKEKESWLKITC